MSFLFLLKERLKHSHIIKGEKHAMIYIVVITLKKLEKHHPKNSSCAL
jgi:hypothetical protein